MTTLARASLLALLVLAISGCQTSPASAGKGFVSAESQAIRNFKTSGRPQMSRVAILYPDSIAGTRLQRELVTQLVDASFVRGVRYTTHSVGSALGTINAKHELKRFGPSHLLRLDLSTTQGTLDGGLAHYSASLRLFDVADGVLVWQYLAKVVVGETTSPQEIARQMTAAMERDGVLRPAQ